MSIPTKETQETFEAVAETMHRLLSDEQILKQCEAREQYHRERASMYAFGKREGYSEATKKNINILIQVLHSAHMPTDFIRSQLMEHYQLSEEVATEKINKYTGEH